jgi:hypothetical protein
MSVPRNKEFRLRAIASKWTLLYASEIWTKSRKIRKEWKFRKYLRALAGVSGRDHIRNGVLRTQPVEVSIVKDTECYSKDWIKCPLRMDNTKFHKTGNHYKIKGRRDFGIPELRRTNQPRISKWVLRAQSFVVRRKDSSSRWNKGKNKLIIHYANCYSIVVKRNKPQSSSFTACFVWLWQRFVSMLSWVSLIEETREVINMYHRFMCTSFRNRPLRNIFEVNIKGMFKSRLGGYKLELMGPGWLSH